MWRQEDHVPMGAPAQAPKPRAKAAFKSLRALVALAAALRGPTERACGALTEGNSQGGFEPPPALSRLVQP
jgi:hypothetical protein